MAILRYRDTLIFWKNTIIILLKLTSRHRHPNISIKLYKTPRLTISFIHFSWFVLRYNSLQRRGETMFSQSERKLETKRKKKKKERKEKKRRRLWSNHLEISIEGERIDRGPTRQTDPLRRLRGNFSLD